MSVPNRERMVTCIHPIKPLVEGGSYIVLREGIDQFTKQHMVEVAGNQRFWAWRFQPGPAMPPMDMHRVRFD